MSPTAKGRLNMSSHGENKPLAFLPPGLARALHSQGLVPAECMYEVLVVSQDSHLRDLIAGASPTVTLPSSSQEEPTSRARVSLSTGHDAGAVVDIMRSRDFDAVVLDLDDQELAEEPLSVCADLCARWPETPVIVISADTGTEAALSAIRAGAYDFVRRPLSQERIDAAVARVARRRNLHRRIEEISEDAISSRGLEDFVGESPVIDSVASIVMKVARSDVTVLITGESGTGKELVARAIHRHSVRRDGPFVPVNCGALTPSLLESELFGHTKGAYTDALKNRQGLFVQATGGTILLDEVADMPIELQVKLLRVLQERSVRPIGGEAETPVDVRIIASTNHDLEERVRTKQFRQDLYYRLNVVRIAIPPLRARGNDVVLLAQHLLLRAATRLGKPVRRISTDAIRLMLNYPWPGNVRELENAIERAVTMSKTDAIAADDLPAIVREHPGASGLRPSRDLGSLPTLAEVEHAHIQRTIDSVDGNKTRAAAILGIDRRTIYRRLGARPGS